MQKKPDDIIIFFIVVSIIILFMIAFIITISYLYNKRQTNFQQAMIQMQLDHEKTLLATQLEIQEITFQNISREIHDNIGLSLSLAKLNLLTLNWDDKKEPLEKINSSIELLIQSINSLNDISKSLNSDLITQQGLINALEYEVIRIQKTGLFKINFTIEGNSVFMNAQRELIIFRIIQESFNNIIKHASATNVALTLFYDSFNLHVIVSDDGNGFDRTMIEGKRHAGLINMETRTKMLHGSMEVKSKLGRGTTLSFSIPFE